MPNTIPKAAISPAHTNDFVSIAKGSSGTTTSLKSARNSVDTEISWKDWGTVKITYYPKNNAEQDSNTRCSLPSLSNNPTTPTPNRRSSNLGFNGPRTNQQAGSDDSASPAARATTFPTALDNQFNSSPRIIEVSSSKLKSAGVHHILKENAPNLPDKLR